MLDKFSSRFVWKQATLLNQLGLRVAFGIFKEDPPRKCAYPHISVNSRRTSELRLAIEF